MGEPFTGRQTPRPGRTARATPTAPKLTVDAGARTRTRPSRSRRPRRSRSPARAARTSTTRPTARRPSSGDLPADTAMLYTAPIPITAANTEVHAVAFDRAGNFDTGIGLYSPSTAARHRRSPHRPPSPPPRARARSSSTGPPSPAATTYQVTVAPAADRRPAAPAPPGPHPDDHGPDRRHDLHLHGDGLRRHPDEHSRRRRDAAAPTVVRPRSRSAPASGRTPTCGSRARTDTAPAAGTIRFYKVGADGKRPTPPPPVGGTAAQP